MKTITEASLEMSQIVGLKVKVCVVLVDNMQTQEEEWGIKMAA